MGLSQNESVAVSEIVNNTFGLKLDGLLRCTFEDDHIGSSWEMIMLRFPADRAEFSVTEEGGEVCITIVDSSDLTRRRMTAFHEKVQ